MIGRNHSKSQFNIVNTCLVASANCCLYVCDRELWIGVLGPFDPIVPPTTGPGSIAAYARTRTMLRAFAEAWVIGPKPPPFPARCGSHDAHQCSEAQSISHWAPTDTEDGKAMRGARGRFWLFFPAGAN